MSDDLHLVGDVRPFLEGEVAEDLVRRYFSPDPEASSGWAFSGGAFETFDGGGDADQVRDQVTAADLVAVTFLGVEVPPHAALALSGPLAGDVSGFLADIPTDVDLFEPDAREHILPGGPADRLWALVNDIHGMGWVTTGKLLARKRPRLLPVFDAVLRDALQPDADNFWLRLHNELQDDNVVHRLREIRDTCALTDRISLIRILDAAVWMRNRRASDNRLPFTVCSYAEI